MFLFKALDALFPFILEGRGRPLCSLSERLLEMYYNANSAVLLHVYGTDDLRFVFIYKI